MANIVQRGLASLNQTVRAVRTGEGESKAARFGKAAKKSIKKARAGLDGLLGFGGVVVDSFEEVDPDEQHRRKRTQMLLGEESAVFVHKDGNARDIGQTVAPEFRAQVASGLVSANSMTAGSTLVEED